jgi:protein-disulfide isomerase
MAKLTPPVNDKDHVSGPQNALVELVEYGDYQCPHCGAAHPVVKAIMKAYGKDLKFVFRNFPLSEAHPYAEAAALAAEAAGKQKKFWEMHDMIYEHQNILDGRALLEFASALGLDMKKFEKDITDSRIAEKVSSDFESGMRSGVNGTPSFFINGLKYNGSYDFESLAGSIEALMGAGHHR